MSAVPKPVAAVDGPGELRWIRLEQIVESRWNPRKHFDPAKLAEMAESLKVNGQLTPIVVRPVKSKLSFSPSTDKYEIGAGHRRFRAAPIAGLTHLLAVVRLLDDVAFLELLTIENKQREDVTPLDEAAGFRLLMEKAGYDVPKLAARVGLSTKYVYDRVKLLQLVPAARQLLESGTITAGHAIILARLSPTDQKRAMGNLKEVVDGGYGSRGDSLLLRADNAAEGELPLHDQVRPVTVREFQQAVQDKIRARPESMDPFLFPESVKALEAAKEEKLSVIHITREYRVDDDARDEKIKTYGAQAWKRADGVAEEKWGTGRPVRSKPCAWSRYGFVAAGPGQGEVFRVCINKQKCAIHWPEQVKAARAAAKRAAKSGSAEKAGNAKPKVDRYEVEEQRRQEQYAREEAERARWKKALPALREALAAKLRAAPTGATSEIARIVLDYCTASWGGAPKAVKDLVPIGRTAEDVLPRAAWMVILNNLNEHRAQSQARVFKAFGLDAQAIVDEVAPKPAEKKDAKLPAKKKAKR